MYIVRTQFQYQQVSSLKKARSFATCLVKNNKGWVVKNPVNLWDGNYLRNGGIIRYAEHPIYGEIKVSWHKW